MSSPRARQLLAPFCSLALFACNGGSTPADAGPTGDAALDTGASDAGPGDAATDLGPFPQWDAGPTPAADPFHGPTAEVEILHDDHGVAHVYGATDTDAMYGAGYAVAMDRLFQLDLTRRQALGRRAEVFGDGKRGDDELARLIDFAGYGRADRDRLLAEHPAEYQNAVAWVAGVNARIDEVRAGTVPLPYGFGPAELDYMPEHWETSDAFAVGKMLTFGLSDSLENDVLGSVLDRLDPLVTANMAVPMPLYPSFVMPPDERAAVHTAFVPHTPSAPVTPRPSLDEVRAGLRHLHALLAPLTPLGSNNWAVAGTHTADGRPFVCGDPHQPLISPAIIHAIHINSADMGGTLDVAGFSFVGAPGVHFGHTARVQWSATTNFADVMDLWDVPIDPGGRTVQMGGMHPRVILRHESILVRGAGMPAGVGSTDDYVVREIEGMGTVVPESVIPIPVVDRGHYVVFDWMGRRATNEFYAFFQMMRAQNVAQMEAAVDLMEVGAVNLIFADASGIAYRVGGKVPDRGNPATHPMPWRVVPADAENLWTGAVLSAERMPHSHGTTRGWLVSANNDPWGFTANGDVTDDPFYYGTWYAPGERSDRIEAELSRLVATGTPLTVADMQSLQTDTHSPVADELVPVLTTSFSHVPTDATLAAYRSRPELDAMVALIAGWDHHFDRASSAAVVFEGFEHFLARRVLGDDIDAAAFDATISQSPIYVLKLLSNTVNHRYPGADMFLQGGLDTLVLEALSDTAAWLTTRFGGTDPGMYTWGAIHGARFDNDYGHALDGGWTSTSGGDDTVSVSQTSFFDGSGNPSMRLDATEGPVYRGVTRFDADGTPVQYAAFPRGNSGDPTSPHWADTLDEWVAGGYHEVPFRRADVDAHMESVVRLPPAP